MPAATRRHLATLAQLSLAVLSAGGRAEAQPEPPPALRVVRQLFLTGGPSHVLRYSPDGTRLASGGDRGDVVIVDADTGARQAVLDASDHWVGGLAFSPNGTRLAAVGRSLTVWDLDSGRQLGEVATGSARALDWSRDGAHLAVVLDNHTAVLLRADDLGVQREFALPGPTAADAIAISPDGQRVAVGKRSGETFVFDTESGAEVERLHQDGWVYDLAYTDAGQLLRLGWRGTHHLFADEPVRFGDFGFSLSVQADGSRCVLVANDGTLLLSAGGERHTLPVKGPAALHPDGVRWASATPDGIEIYTGIQVQNSLPALHRQQPRQAVLTGDGRFVVAAGRDLQVFDADTGAAVQVAGLPREGVDLIANPQGVELAVLRKATGRQPRALELYALEPTAAGHGARLVRGTAVHLRARSVLPALAAPRLSRHGRALCYADQVIDLIDPKASLYLEQSLIAQTIAVYDQGCAVARRPVFDHFGGGHGSLHVFALDGDERLQLPLAVPPRALALAPRGDVVASAEGDWLVLRSVPELVATHRIAVHWRAVLWLDDHWLVGCGAGDQLELANTDRDTAVSFVRLSSWASSLDYNAARRLLLATTQDRVVILRVDTGTQR